MKKNIKLALVIATVISIFGIMSCDSEFNEDIMYGTVGSSLDKTPPGEVGQMICTPKNNAAALKWINPSDKDFLGVTITVSCDNKKITELPQPVTFTVSDESKDENEYVFYDLINNENYNFLIKTFDQNLNYSAGSLITCVPKQLTDLSQYKVEELAQQSKDQCVVLTWSNKSKIQKTVINSSGESTTSIISEEMDGFEGVLITYYKTTDIENKKSITLQKIDGTVPDTCTIYGLENDETYQFVLKQFNQSLEYGSENSITATPRKDANNEIISYFIAEQGDSKITLKWTNPTSSNFYGVKLSASLADPDSDGSLGNLSSSLFFLGNELTDSYVVEGLTNNESYNFQICTVDNKLNLGPAKVTSQYPTPNRIASVRNPTAAVGDSFVVVSWQNPSDDDLYGIKIIYSEIETDNQTGEETKLNTKQISFVKDTIATLPSSCKISDLKNDTKYEFIIYDCNSYLNWTASSTLAATPQKDLNSMQVSYLRANPSDKQTILYWTNPSDENFYGVMIEASSNSKTANIPSRITLINSDKSKIPSNYTFYELTNDVIYDFTVYTIDKKMNFSNSPSKVSVMPKANENKIDVDDFSCLIYSEKIKLSWKNPADVGSLDHYELTISPPIDAKGFVNINKSSEGLFQAEYEVTGLTNDVSYTFTLRTVDTADNKSIGVYLTATPNSGSSGLSSCPDFINYKTYTIDGKIYSYKAYDFGYCNKAVTKEFKIVSSSTMNLDKSTKTYNSGTGSFEISTNSSTVESNQDYTITVTYTPKDYDSSNDSTASWDEVTYLVAGDSKNAIKFIGSNFPQPNNMGTYNSETRLSSNLKVWLRADMISDENLDGKAVKTFPDYSGNENNANCLDTEYFEAPFYIGSDDDFNNLPCINYNSTGRTQSQLLVLGKNGLPIFRTEKGITSFVVFVNDNKTASQGIISTNYGTSFPTVVLHARYYNNTGFYVPSDYKIGIGLKGNNMRGDWRWACINNKTDDDNNQLLPIGLGSSASGLQSTVPSMNKTLNVCSIYKKQSPLKKDNGDLPSNIRMFVNGDERLLSYIWSNDSNYTSAKLNNKLISDDGLTPYGSYGKPWGDGKGNRYGSLSEIAKPSSKDAADDGYNLWYKAAGEDAKKIGREFDRAMNITPAGAISTVASSSNNGDRDYFENWISTDTFRNGTMNVLTIGPDTLTSSNCYSKIAEVIIFDYDLSDEEIDTVNNYIKYRYDIKSISLKPSEYIK